MITLTDEYVYCNILMLLIICYESLRELLCFLKPGFCILKALRPAILTWIFLVFLNLQINVDTIPKLQVITMHLTWPARFKFLKIKLLSVKDLKITSLFDENSLFKN
jgi:hypothetical protein